MPNTSNRVAHNLQGFYKYTDKAGSIQWALVRCQGGVHRKPNASTQLMCALCEINMARLYVHHAPFPRILGGVEEFRHPIGDCGELDRELSLAQSSAVQCKALPKGT